MNNLFASDPLERQVETALRHKKLQYVHESQSKEATQGLDFYLPTLGVHIEVKQFHTDRIARQMQQARDVVVLQGQQAVDFFCSLMAVAP